MARQVIFDRGGSLSTIAGLLQEDYVRDEIRTLVNTSTYFLSQIYKQKKATTHGKKFILPVKTAVSQGQGARGENVVLPDPGFGEYDQLMGNVKYLYAGFYITGPSMESTKGNQAAFADALTRALEDTKEGYKLDKQRQVWGDSSAVMGKVSAITTAGNTITVTDPYGLTYVQNKLEAWERVMTFRRGQNIYITTPGGAGTNVYATITGVNPSNGTLILSQNVTVAVGDLIYRGDGVGRTNVGNELTGINAIMQTTGTYMGLDRTNIPELQANIITASGTTAGLEDDMQIVSDTVFRNGTGDSEGWVIITNTGVRRLYVRGLQSQRRQVNPMKLEGGFNAVEFDGKALMVDKDCPPQREYFLRMEDIHTRYMGEEGWMDADGNMLNRVTAGGNRDAYEATWKSYEDMVTEAPSNHAVLQGVVSG